MRCHKFIMIISVITVLSGCSVKESRPSNYPDYSTPETTFRTEFYAEQIKDSKTMLNCLTDEYKAKFGRNINEQLLAFSKNMETLKSKNRKKTIHNIIYGRLGEFDAMITWSETIGTKTIIKRSWVHFKKVGNEWKIAFSEKPSVHLFTLKPLSDNVLIDKIVSPQKND